MAKLVATMSKNQSPGDQSVNMHPPIHVGRAMTAGAGVHVSPKNVGIKARPVAVPKGGDHTAKGLPGRPTGTR